MSAQIIMHGVFAAVEIVVVFFLVTFYKEEKK